MEKGWLVIALIWSLPRVEISWRLVIATHLVNTITCLLWCSGQAVCLLLCFDIVWPIMCTISGGA